MKFLLKLVGWGLLGLILVAAAFVGTSFLFPKWFAPNIKTTELRAPSGAVFRVMQRGPIRGIKDGARTLGVQYLAESLGDVERLKRESDELEALVRPETSTGNFDSLVVMAYRIAKQRGFVSYGQTINTVFEHAASVGWEIFTAKPQSEFSPKEEAARRELLAAYSKLDQAVRDKDPRAIWEMETADYTDTLLNGEVMNKDADMTYMQKQFAELTTVSAFNVSIESLSLDGDKATVTIKSGFSGVVNNEARKDEVYYSQGTSRDVWRRTKDGWRIKESVDLGSKSFFFKP
ncbi:MAG: nuclear transport factor 2 family protein [Elusimicrobia bacterium]|nr:nuclear transport factor 2 family protein [Elusimicrobiota bacterium]